MSSGKPLDPDPPGRVETATPSREDCAPCQARGVKCSGISIGNIGCKACADHGIVCLPPQKTHGGINVLSDLQVRKRQEEYQGWSQNRVLTSTEHDEFPEVSRDYAALAFSSPSISTLDIFLARGSAADVWVASSQSKYPTLHVVKVLRISASHFDDISTENDSSDSNNKLEDNGEINVQATSGEMSWRRFVRLYRNQVSKWALLRHNNVILVYDQYESLDLHVENCYYGSIRDYLKARPSEMISKNSMIYSILKGLDYLHDWDPPIVHGSLNAGKIFVDVNHEVKIGEFGLAALCYHAAPHFPSIMFSGFSRWMSPELLDTDPDGDDIAEPTEKSDIWALGCTIYEIAAEELPYSKYTHDIRIQRAVLGGELPGDPAAPPLGEEIPGIDTVLRLCWSMQPVERPTADSLLSSDM